MSTVSVVPGSIGTSIWPFRQARWWRWSAVRAAVNDLAAPDGRPACNPPRAKCALFGEPLFSGSRADQLARRHRFGMLFQHGALFSALNVFANVAFPLREFGVSDEAMLRDLVLLKLAMAELEPDVALRMPAELSGGMIKRVALAGRWPGARLLILDRPTAGLDPDLSAGLLRLIRALHKALGLTVIPRHP